MNHFGNCPFQPFWGCGDDGVDGDERTIASCSVQTPNLRLSFVCRSFDRRPIPFHSTPFAPFHSAPFHSIPFHRGRARARSGASPSAEREPAPECPGLLDLPVIASYTSFLRLNLAHSRVAVLLCVSARCAGALKFPT